MSEKNVGKETVLEKRLDKTEKIVYSCISLDPIQFVTLFRSLKMNIDELQFALMKFKLAGMTQRLLNKYFIKKV
ncbi:MAG: hypothetical protein H7X94_11790 [Vallitaleaceae bacterium]|nr:hypothetical protein [Vallitaleaceae bacterium]